MRAKSKASRAPTAPTATPKDTPLPSPQVCTHRGCPQEHGHNEHQGRRAGVGGSDSTRGELGSPRVSPINYAPFRLSSRSAHRGVTLPPLQTLMSPGHSSLS